jgi:hypothetical protein
MGRCSNLPFHLQSISCEASTALANLFRGCHAHSQGILQTQLIEKCGDTFDSFFYRVQWQESNLPMNDPVSHRSQALRWLSVER